MPKRNRFQQGMDHLRTEIEHVADAVRAAADEGGGEVHINRAGRNNIAIAGTAGEVGAHESVSSHQTTHIRQRDGKTVEETATTSTCSSEGANEA